jgi:hypothetical protein
MPTRDIADDLARLRKRYRAAQRPTKKYARDVTCSALSACRGFNGQVLI